MKSSVKIVAGLMLALAVIGAITVLAVKYFDALAKIFDGVKNQIAGITGKKTNFCGDSCCDYDDDDEDIISAFEG